MRVNNTEWLLRKSSERLKKKEKRITQKIKVGRNGKKRHKKEETE